MDALPCGCAPSSNPPYVHFCARHDPDRVKALEQLTHDILDRAQAVFQKLDSAEGTWSPLLVKTSAADAMQDLLEEFVPRYRKLISLSSPLPSDVVPGPTDRAP